MRNLFISIYLWAMIGTVTLLAFLLLVPLVILLGPFDHQRNTTHWVAWVWARVVFALNPFWSLNVEGRDKLNPRQAYLLAVNHQSMGDIVALYWLGIPFKWIAKRSMLLVPVVGWAMYLGAHVPVVRGDKESGARAVRVAKSWLMRGISIMIFPEGTRSADGKVHSFRDGAFRMSLETGTPVVPIAIEGTGTILPKKSWLFPTQRQVVHVVVGDPIHPPVTIADARQAPRELDAMRDTARRWIVREVARLRGTSVASIDSNNRFSVVGGGGTAPDKSA